MEGDTARIFALEKSVKRQTEIANSIAREVNQIKADTLTYNIIVFTLCLLCCMATVLFCMLR